MKQERKNHSLIAIVGLTAVLVACRTGNDVTPTGGDADIAQVTTAMPSGATGSSNTILAAATSVTITSNCDRNGNCDNATYGASRAARITCVSATGDRPNQYTPACNPYCVPNCGGTRLEAGKSGHTSGPGTITLLCDGQVPSQCKLRIEVQ